MALFWILPFILVLTLFWGAIQSWRLSKDRRLIFENRGWIWLNCPEKEVIYRVEGEAASLKWRLEASKNSQENTTQTLWSAPGDWPLKTGVASPSLLQKLNDNPLAFGAMRWMMRREMKKPNVLEGFGLEAETTEAEKSLIAEATLRLFQDLQRTRPLSRRELEDFRISNSMWHEDAVRQIFDAQFERNLAAFLAKIPKTSRKSFACHLEKERIVLRVSADLPAPLAIEMVELGVAIETRARHFCGQEKEVFNAAALRRALQHLPASLREQMRDEFSQELAHLGEF